MLDYGEKESARLDYRDVVKNPIVEDREYCANGTHLWVLREDKTIYCYNCGIEFKRNKK